MPTRRAGRSSPGSSAVPEPPAPAAHRRSVVRAGRPRRARRHPPPVLQPLDPRRLRPRARRVRRRRAGVPVAVGRRRLRRQDRRGLRGRRQGRLRQQDPVLQRGGQDLHRRLPEGRPPQGEEGPRVHRADHRRAWSRATSRCTRSACTSGCRVPWCPSSQWFECPCHGSKYNRVGEKQGGPAPRGLDRFVLEVSGGNIIVDTGSLVIGPPIGTEHHRPEPRGSALCLTPRRDLTECPPRMSFRTILILFNLVAIAGVARLRRLPRRQPAAEPGAEGAREPHAVLRRRRARGRAPRARARRLADRAGRSS